MSLFSALLDVYGYIDDRFDLDHVLHYKHAVERLQEHGRTLSVLAGMALPAAGASRFAPPIVEQQPVEVVIDVRNDLDGFFTAIVREGASGRLMVVSPSVSSVEGAMAAARHMHVTGELLTFQGVPERSGVTPVPVRPIEAADVQASG